MSTLNYTKDNKGLQKMRELLTIPKIVMMATHLDKTPFSVCPMTLQKMDEQGDLWFLSGRDTEHFQDIERDNKVQLIYTDEANHTYISIFGNATHIVDEQQKHELWSTQGGDTNNGAHLVLLNVNMESAYYWESSTNRLVSFFDEDSAKVENKESQRGNKGHINLQNH